MRELINDVVSEYPTDVFFVDIGLTLRQSSQARALYRAYDRALSYLDRDSWQELRRKALVHFKDHRKGQLKQGFFNQLHDAFAYQFLVRSGCTNVAVLSEKKNTKMPDLQYFVGDVRHFCEVKTIGVSEQELARRTSDSFFDGSIYQELSDSFLNKLESIIFQAQCQISSQGGTGLVFIVVNFDDFTLCYLDRYREQITAFLEQHEVQDVYIKVGLVGGARISKGRFA
ncbi:hypothetical protein BA896_003110 [Janthinobacterium lividum]|uniref:Uncharacterized protein n=1 Tax=Janthinobacterium lividum TaxID=29581 RepID=A0A1E8PQ42_9BURK|nr:hypothetical protein BA896_003110 [Janthinobacterium lividum]